MQDTKINNYPYLVSDTGTHDIQNISITSTRPGEIRVTGDFIDGSTAAGILVVVSGIDLEIGYNLILRKSGELQLEGSVSGLIGGEYNNSIFVVEEDGLPFRRVATGLKSVLVGNGKH